MWYLQIFWSLLLDLFEILLDQSYQIVFSNTRGFDCKQFPCACSESLRNSKTKLQQVGVKFFMLLQTLNKIYSSSSNWSCFLGYLNSNLLSEIYKLNLFTQRERYKLNKKFLARDSIEKCSSFKESFIQYLANVLFHFVEITLNI